MFSISSWLSMEGQIITRQASSAAISWMPLGIVGKMVISRLGMIMPTICVALLTRLWERDSAFDIRRLKVAEF